MTRIFVMALSSSNDDNMPSLTTRKGDRNHRNADPRPSQARAPVATGESNRKPFLSHRKAMGIFESTNGGRRWSGWELQVVTQTSSFRRSIASRPSRLSTADVS